MNSIIEIVDLHRNFQVGSETIQVLKGINLSIEAGKLTMLCGPSGSGKTTLMNLAGTLDEPNEGKVLFNGRDTSSLSESEKDLLRRNKIAFIFQSVALMPLMSAYENVEYSLRINKTPIRERRKRVEECLDMVGLLKRANHLTNEMSGGEQQRVAIARAIVQRPEIIFADEPTAELDSTMGLHVIRLLKKMVEKEGMTVVMTTHDQDIVLLADVLYRMRDGEIINE
ncbi:MAG: ABC transporter ATP-binding protein [Mobilitalea sp.]